MPAGIGDLLAAIGAIRAGEPWHLVGGGGEPAFQNSWVNYGGAYATAAFMKDALGFVHLRGTMKSGTMSATAFQLPAGYRPTATLTFATYGSAAVPGISNIDSSGNVLPWNGANVAFCLDGITFRAA